MTKILKYTLALSFIGLITQSCEKQAEPTYMEDFLVAEDFAPDWTDNLTTIENWETLPNDGEGEMYPYYYKITGKPNSVLTMRSFGLRFDAFDGGWGQRVPREGFEVDGDFEIEFKGRMVQGSGDAEWQKGGIFVGDIGDVNPKLWLSLENPIEPENARICRYVPGAPTEWWWDIDHHNFSQFEWQVIKAVRKGSTLKIYRNDVLVASETGNHVLNIKGKVGLHAEALSFEYEYLSVNGEIDDFSDMSNWSNLDTFENTMPSLWTTTEAGLNVVAQGGSNHRALGDAVPENFIVEFKIKIQNPNSGFPKAGIMVGELGSSTPDMILGLDNYNGGNMIVKFLKGRPGGEWGNFGSPGLDVNKWQTIRFKKDSDNMYVYINGTRVYYEKGDYIANIQGRLGFYVEGCEADIEYLSFKAN